MQVFSVLLRGAIALGFCALLAWADGARRAELLPARARTVPLPAFAESKAQTQTPSKQLST